MSLLTVQQAMKSCEKTKNKKTVSVQSELVITTYQWGIDTKLEDAAEVVQLQNVGWQTPRLQEI